MKNNIHAKIERENTKSTRVLARANLVEIGVRRMQWFAINVI